MPCAPQGVKGSYDDKNDNDDDDNDNDDDDNDNDDETQHDIFYLRARFSQF